MPVGILKGRTDPMPNAHDMKWIEKIEWQKCPDSLQGGLRRWAEEGIYPGGFLRAVLENDLRESFKRADNKNLGRMFTIVSFMFNQMPAGCWGSPEKVLEWHESFRARG